MFVRTMQIAWAGIASLSLGVAAPATWEHPEVARWAETVEASSSSEAERNAALDRLRDAARGEPREQLTREAILALSLLLDEENQARPDEAALVMKSAAAYYPEDPRSGEALLRLARMQLDADRTVEAHFSLIRLFERKDVVVDPELVVRAAANAEKHGDPSLALSWSDRVAAGQVPTRLQPTLWRVRLVSAAALRQFARAKEATDRLEQIDRTLLRQHDDAMLAAARTDAALGRLDAAVERFGAFINIHPRHAERPAAMIEYAQILARVQRPAAAIRTLDWIVENHADAPQADRARLQRVQIDPDLDPVARAEAYRNVALELRAPTDVAEACQRILETLLAAGRPLEAVSTLGWIVRNGDPFRAGTAQKQLRIGLEPIVALLADRADDLGLAAVAAEAESLRIPLPETVARLVSRSRQGLGLAFHESLETAQAHARVGRWDLVPIALGADSPPSETLGPAQVALRERLLAEAAWRDGSDAAALDRIAAALGDRAADLDSRGLLVLRADIRAASGQRESACADYRAASRIATSPWVGRQLAGCGEDGGTSGEGQP